MNLSRLKNISKIIMSSCIFNLNGFLAIIFKKKPHFKCEPLVPMSNKGFYVAIGFTFYDNIVQNHTPYDNTFDFGHIPLSTWNLNDCKMCSKHPKTTLHIFSNWFLQFRKMPTTFLLVAHELFEQAFSIEGNFH
jgi:hypothetical protein